MSILLFAAIVLLGIAFVCAYYTGKAELTVNQMLRQREVEWSFWGAYICWALASFSEPAYSYGDIIIRFVTIIVLWLLLIPVHTAGVRRKQAQRDK